MKLYKIKKSGIDNKGKGLYATRDIKEGEKMEYVYIRQIKNLVMDEIIVNGYHIKIKA